MADTQSVWVFIEQNEGKIADVSLELLGKARDLADALHYELTGVLLGSRVKDLAPKVIAHGADRVLLADHPDLDGGRYRRRAGEDRPGRIADPGP